MSNPAIKQDTPKHLRQQAASSVAQDMSSARLRILSDLMESRKKAEAHEQEFLKTIHSENAAFTKVVSLFEDSIEGLEASIGSVRADVEVKLSESFALSDVAVNAMMEEVRTLKQRSTEDSMLFKEEIMTSLKSETTRLDTQWKKAEYQNSQLSGIVSELDSRINTEISKISQEQCSIRDSLQEKMNGLEDSIRVLTSGLNEIALSHKMEVEKQQNSLEEILHRHQTEVLENVESRLVDLQSQIEHSLEAKLKSVEQASNESISLLLSERIESFRQELHTGLRTTNSHLESRCESIEASVSSLPTKLVMDESVLVSFEKDMKQRWQEDLSSKMNLLADQISDLDMRISARLGTQDSAIQALRSTGYFHEWTIRDAKSKLHSLGLMSTGGKFVSSETFSIGPYSNLQLRLYPVSSSLSSSPSIWLIHSPSGSDAAISLPLYVDLGIGKSKKALCRMKKVQELFGHWVWEGNGFDRDFVVKEVDTAGSLVVNVEISMRQWLAPTDAVSGNVTVPLENYPDSPMSAYTFAGGIEGRITPQLPLRPMSTNPFENQSREKDGQKSALTPRRMSWAMFGDAPLEETLVPPSNPFSS